MADESGVKYSDVLRIAGAMLLGGALSAPASAVRSTRASDVLKGAALSYPGLPEDFVYPMQYIPNAGGYANMNAALDRNLTYRYPLAQTLEEHNRAVANGTEKQLESWWPETDTRPRADFHPSSSAVSDIRIDTNNNILIRFGGKGKWYSYRGGSNPREASLAVKDLVTAPSIGRALPRNGRYVHNGKKDYRGTPDANVGWWGRQHELK